MFAKRQLCKRNRDINRMWDDDLYRIFLVYGDIPIFVIFFRRYNGSLSMAEWTIFGIHDDTLAQHLGNWNIIYCHRCSFIFPTCELAFDTMLQALYYLFIRYSRSIMRDLQYAFIDLWFWWSPFLLDYHFSRIFSPSKNQQEGNPAFFLLLSLISLLLNFEIITNTV